MPVLARTVAALALLAFTVPAIADDALPIQARLTQPHSGDCSSSAFFGFGTYLAMAQGNAVVGERHTSRGCTVVYEPDGANGWNVLQILHASGALAASDNRMLVGLTVFARRDGLWSATASLPGPSDDNHELDEELNDGVALDGDMAVAGFGNAGTAMVYTLDDSGTPAGSPILLTATGEPGNGFGCRVAVTDGVVAVASHAAVFMFSQDSSGQWHQQARFDAGDCTALAAGDGAVASVDTAGSVRVATRSASGRWGQSHGFGAPGTEEIFLAAGAGRLAVGGPEEYHGGVDLYDDVTAASGMPQRHVDNERGAIWFGGPLALDRHYLLVGEDACQDGIPCTPMTVDVADVSDGDGGFGGFGFACFLPLALVAFLRRRARLN